MPDPRLSSLKEAVGTGGAHGHFHGHGHSHSHSHILQTERGALSGIGGWIFAYDSSSNAILAVTLVTAVTQLLFAICPPLPEPMLTFLVAFAAGGMLATVFVHILPEIHLTRDTGLFIAATFLAFAVIDKTLRLVGSATEEHSAGSHSHTHSHAHSHSHGHSHKSIDHGAKTAEQNLALETAEPAGLKHRRASRPEPMQETTLDASKPLEEGHDAESKMHFPWLNVLADLLHNVTDGISLAVAFQASSSAGFAAFIVMCCHEIPHQFGDFALLIRSGTSRSTARKAQLMTALGSLSGCVLGNLIGHLPSIEASAADYVNPLAAGAFLYVVTIGVLPELLEFDESSSTLVKIRDFALQICGVAAGIFLLVLLD